MNYPEKITIRGLPQVDGTRLNPEKKYMFSFGRPNYLDMQNKLTLHIPEEHARDAEGRPQQPEQSEWINELIKTHSLDVKGVWWSHWVFKNEESYLKFKELLLQ